MKKSLLHGACAVFLAAPLGAHAALGGTVEPAVAARTVTRAATARAAYTVHESSTSAGTVVREYAGPDGRVFAVSWEGPVKPDVRRLLGNYFAPYTAALRARRGTLRRAAVERDGLVVRSDGHVRAFRGLAYLAAGLPPGVTVEELQ